MQVVATSWPLEFFLAGWNCHLYIEPRGIQSFVIFHLFINLFVTFKSYF